MLTFQDQVQADDSYDRFKIFCQNHNLMVQPRVHFIGCPINVAELLIVDRKFIFANPLEAVETAYLFFNSLNIQYPEQSDQVWRAISDLIFNLNENKFLKSSQKTLLNNIKNKIV